MEKSSLQVEVERVDPLRCFGYDCGQCKQSRGKVTGEIIEQWIKFCGVLEMVKTGLAESKRI